MDDTRELLNAGCTVEATAQLVKDLHKPQLIEIPAYGDNPASTVIAVPKGRSGGFELIATSKFTDDEREHPSRRVGRAELRTLQSFIDHVQRFRNPEAALFAKPSMGDASLMAVFDYHQRCNVPEWEEEDAPRAMKAVPDAKPAYMMHRAGYAFPFSKEWHIWTKINRQPMDQMVFAEFLENNILDVMEPPGFMTGGVLGEELDPKDRELLEAVSKIEGKLCGSRRLMELSRGLYVNEGAKIENFVRLQTGEAKLTFVTEHQDEHGKAIDVPSCFLLAIPVFDEGAPYRILVRLRYRIKNGSLVWFLELHRHDKAFDHAFREACAEAVTQTDLPLFYGSPEA